MLTIFQRFLEDRKGATAIEYGLIAALISVALIGGLTAFHNSMAAAFNAIATASQDAVDASPQP